VASFLELIFWTDGQGPTRMKTIIPYKMKSGRALETMVTKLILNEKKLSWSPILTVSRKTIVLKFTENTLILARVTRLGAFPNFGQICKKPNFAHGYSYVRITSLH
jgi:hypothetical protein